MFNPTQIVIEAFIDELRQMYGRTYSTLEPSYPGIISFAAQLALETIATSDAAYHDVNHTIMVTLVGQEILRGRHISVGGVTPHDWLHFIISLLCHDIGYVRGICRGDSDGQYVINLAGDKVSVPEGATDAAMTPYHVARSKKRRGRCKNISYHSGLYVVSFSGPRAASSPQRQRYPAIAARAATKPRSALS